MKTGHDIPELSDEDWVADLRPALMKELKVKLQCKVRALLFMRYIEQ